MWEWMGGTDLLRQPTIYAPANLQQIGGRLDPMCWFDRQQGNLFVFGGYGYASGTTLGYLNDMWKIK